MTKVYSKMAALLEARRNCIKQNNKVWRDNHTDEIIALCKDYMPHGSGFDSGTTVDFDSCTYGCMVFNTAYHHMNENGYYDGWTEHTVYVRPDFHGVSIRVTGVNKNDIKDYIAESFDIALHSEVKITA